MAKKKKKQFRPFESSNVIDCFEDNYLCITKSMMMNKNWLSLTGNSKTLYFYMKLWAYGREQFKFSYKLAQSFIKNHKTIYNSINQLVEKGFIDIVSISKQVGYGTTYKFSERWWKDMK